jgi:hypothetical protein
MLIIGGKTGGYATDRVNLSIQKCSFLRESLSEKSKHSTAEFNSSAIF